MRRARVKVKGEAFYHVMSRCALQQFLLTDDVKGMFMKILRRAERFSGVRIINYCVMDNHFHLLVKVPKRQAVSDEELEERITVLYGTRKSDRIFARWKMLCDAGNGAAVDREREAFRKRMYDLSEFMKTFKQRFSLWYCSNNGGIEGTIWQGPFHSVLVEGNHDALSAISAYITLNPVRAGLVANARDFPWSGYGAAMTGDKKALAALLSHFGEHRSLAEKIAGYEALISDSIEKSGIRMENRDEEESGTDGEGGVPHDAMLRKEHDVSRGVAFGSRKFVKRAISLFSPLAHVLTIPRAYCLGPSKTTLYCAGRHRA